MIGDGRCVLATYVMDARPQIKRGWVVRGQPDGGVEVCRRSRVVIELAKYQAPLEMRSGMSGRGQHGVTIGEGRCRVPQVVGDAATVKADRRVVRSEFEGGGEVGKGGRQVGFRKRVSPRLKSGLRSRPDSSREPR